MIRSPAELTGWCLGIAGAAALCITISSANAQVLGAPAPGASALGAPALGASEQAPPPTIVVLPLENSSGDATQDFFTGGMTDEIAAALTGVRGLDVVARSSSFRLPPPMRDAKTIGQTLNASYLVQGSARMTADRVRMDVRLVRANDGAALWSKEYDAEPTHVFDLEEEIARSIAAALKMPVSSGTALVRSRTVDFETYLDFLRAKVAARERGGKALAEAAVFLERVVMRDPDFAPASALLAYDYALTPLFAPSLRGGMPEDERKIVERTIPRSDALARRATQLDPKAADGFVALGYANLV
jgi:TolB-like protein